MLADKTLDIIRGIVERCDEISPSLKEIAKFEEEVLKNDAITFRKGQAHIDEIIRSVDEFKTITSERVTSTVTKLEEKQSELEKEVMELTEKCKSLELKHEQQLVKKVALETAMEKFQNDKDMILAYKCATLSHFEYTGKLKFGFLLDKKTLTTKTFAFDPKIDSTKEDVEERWRLLGEFLKTLPKATEKSSVKKEGADKNT